MNEWILTDDDCCQYVKQLDKTVFKLIEVSVLGYNDESAVYVETIDLDDFDDDSIQEVVKGYGYRDIQEVKEIYGDSANQIIAECLFESRVVWLPHKMQGTQAECEDFVHQYIKEH